MISGVDVSSYQTPRAGTLVGLDFVFAKATQGHTMVDADFAAWWALAGAAGITRGAYHFPSYRNTPATDLAHFASVVGPVLRPGDLVVLDYESDGTAATPATTTAWKDEWLALAKSRWPDHRVGLYCNLDWWHGTDDTCGDFLWIADITTAGAPRVVHPWTFHQYGEEADLDLDVANFPDAAALRSWAVGATYEPTSEPTTQSAAQSEDTMPTFATGQLLPGFACDANGTVVDATKATLVVTPPANGGALPWGDMWLSLGCDFDPARVRVAIHVDGETSWRVQTVQIEPPVGRLVVAKLPANTGKISLCRVPLSPQDANAATPVAWLIEAGVR